MKPKRLDPRLRSKILRRNKDDPEYVKTEYEKHRRRMENPDHVRLAMVRIFHETREGRIPVSVSKALTSNANVILTAMALEEEVKARERHHAYIERILAIEERKRLPLDFEGAILIEHNKEEDNEEDS